MDAGVAEQVGELFRGGAAVVAATANAEGRPSITRGWGPTISGDGYVVVCLTACTGSAMRSNLAAKGRIAVTAAHPVTYNSAQVKGTVDVVRDPTDDEFDRVEAHRARFAGAAAEVGLADAGCIMLGDLVTVGLLDTTADDLNLSPGPRRAGTKPGAGSGARSVSFHDSDGTVLIDGDYIIRGVAGRILFAMLTEYERSGRVRFSNRELRLNRDIGLPAGNDNLDARLVTLRRRLAERGDPFQLQSAGRGQLELIVSSAVHVERNDLP